MHARAFSQGVARVVVLLWRQVASASRSARTAAAAAAADLAAANQSAEVQLQRVALQLVASADALRKRQLDDVVTSFRSMITANQLHATVLQSSSFDAGVPLAQQPGVAIPEHDDSSLNFSSANLDLGNSHAAGFRSRSLSVSGQPVELSGDDSNFTHLVAARIAERGLSQRVDSGPTDSALSMDARSSAHKRQMSRHPFVWLVLRRALLLWRRRHASDFRIIKDVQRKLKLQQHQLRQLQQQNTVLRAKVESIESALEYERFHVVAIANEAETCRVELMRVSDAANSTKQELKLAVDQLKEAAASAASAEALAAAQSEKSAAALQAAMEEQHRLKEAATLQGMRATLLMQEQLQLMKQLDDANKRNRKSTYRCRALHASQSAHGNSSAATLRAAGTAEKRSRTQFAKQMPATGILPQQKVISVVWPVNRRRFTQTFT
jgi:hypothetical protein